VQTAEAGHPLGAGSQHEVIGVAEHDVGAEFAHLIRIHRLDGRGGADRHEGGRANGPPRHRDGAGAGMAVAGMHREAEFRAGRERICHRFVV
jgi:hypothetical protein